MRSWKTAEGESPWTDQPGVFLNVFGTSAEWVAEAPGEGYMIKPFFVVGSMPYDPFGEPSKEGSGFPLTREEALELAEAGAG